MLWCPAVRMTYEGRRRSVANLGVHGTLAAKKLFHFQFVLIFDFLFLQLFDRWKFTLGSRSVCVGHILQVDSLDQLFVPSRIYRWCCRRCCLVLEIVFRFRRDPFAQTGNDEIDGPIARSNMIRQGDLMQFGFHEIGFTQDSSARLVVFISSCLQLFEFIVVGRRRGRGRVRTSASSLRKRLRRCRMRSENTPVLLMFSGSDIRRESVLASCRTLTSSFLV